MKEISINKKLKVIKLFFAGYTYDEIAMELGIAKGSVVNIIDEFRDGELQIAPNEYIDALRELAVDIRKQHTTVKKLQMYIKIDHKVAEMGVGIEDVDDWLDIAQDIATEPASMKQFVSAALELSQMEMETGLNSAALVAEYKNTAQALSNMKAELANSTKLKEKEDAELDSVNKARVAAQEQYNIETAELKAKLDDFMAQNQLSWDKVNTVMAILEGEFSEKGMSEEEKTKISKCIANTASLVSYNNGLRKEKEELEEHIPLLKEDKHNLELANTALQKHNDQLASHVYAVMEEKKVLEKQLEETKVQLGELKIVKYQYAEDIYTGWLVLAVLHNPEIINDSDIDWFAGTINGVRMARLGKKPKQAVDSEGNVICQCHVPVTHIPLEDCGAAMDKARERLAKYLVPLVGDKFIPKFDYEQKKLMNEINAIYKQLLDVLSGSPKSAYQSVEQPEPVVQEVTTKETHSNEPNQKISTETTAPQELTLTITGISELSPEVIKSKWKMEKEFAAKVGPRTCNTPYPWEGTNKP